jgi:hypothetical protein
VILRLAPTDHHDGCAHRGCHDDQRQQATSVGVALEADEDGLAGTASSRPSQRPRLRLARCGEGLVDEYEFGFCHG